MTTRRMSMWCLAVAVLLLLPLMAAAQGTVRIVQTNSAGDNVHIIDPVTNTVVGEITGIERAHGAAPSPDGRDAPPPGVKWSVSDGVVLTKFGCTGGP